MCQFLYVLFPCEKTVVGSTDMKIRSRGNIVNVYFGKGKVESGSLNLY